MPALRHMNTDDGQDEIGDRVAEEKMGQTFLVLEMGLAQAKGTLEISEQFLNPETILVPGHGLPGMLEGSTKIPNTIA